MYREAGEDDIEVLALAHHARYELEELAPEICNQLEQQLPGGELKSKGMGPV